MRVTNVKKNSVKVKQIGLWDRAIAEARKKIERLQAAISDFEQRRDAGERWPTVESKGHEQHSV